MATEQEGFTQVAIWIIKGNFTEDIRLSWILRNEYKYFLVKIFQMKGLYLVRNPWVAK